MNLVTLAETTISKYAQLFQINDGSMHREMSPPQKETVAAPALLEAQHIPFNVQGGPQEEETKVAGAVDLAKLKDPFFLDGDDLDQSFLHDDDIEENIKNLISP